MKRAPTEKDIQRFYSAAQYGDSRGILSFLDTYGDGQVDTTASKFFMGEGMTALMIVAQCNREGAVRQLLSRGADVRLKDTRGLSALGHAVFYGRDRDPEEDYVVDILIATGARWQDDIAVMEEYLHEKGKPTSGRRMSKEDWLSLKTELETRYAEIHSIVKNPERLTEYNHRRADEVTAAVQKGTTARIDPLPRITLKKGSAAP